MYKLFILLVLVGCSTVSPITKDMAEEVCSHSKIHQDIAILAATDKLLEPTSVHIHCNCEYGFPYNEEKKRCMTKEEIKNAVSV